MILTLSDPVDSETEKRYHYIQSKGSFVCLQQNPISLLWLLYIRDKFLPTAPLHFSPRKRRHAIKTLILYRLKMRHPDTLLTLPVYGNISQPVHRGYRVFDLQRMKTFKVIDSNVDRDIIAGEIKAVRTSSDLSFAPSLRRWNLEEGWYEQDFVRGRLGYPIPNSDPSELLKIYHGHFAHFIKEMILLQPPLKVSLSDYLDNLYDIFKDERLLSLKLDSAKINAIQSFVDNVVEEIDNTNHCSVDLIFSHGDFSFVNAVNTSTGMRILDWESAARRSLLNDLYNYFFTELYYERVEPKLGGVIKEAISSLQSSLETEAQDLACDLLPSATNYRRLYYLERIKMLLDRKLNDHLLNVALRSIKVFNDHEIAMGHRPFGLPQSISD